MSTMVEHAELELRKAGMFDKDADYNGAAGTAVMELVKTLAAQGHSGCSAMLVVDAFTKLAKYETLTPLSHPAQTGEFIRHFDEGVLQSTRRPSVFSEDGGKTWYDLDRAVPFWKRMLGVRRHYLKFS